MFTLNFKALLKMKSKFFNLRAQLLIKSVEWSKPLYTRLFKKHKQAWFQDMNFLLACPPKSLGQELGQFLKKEGFDLLPKLEDHDVMHVLMKYKTTVEDEVKMQFFLIGNGKKSIYAWVSMLIGLLLIPEYYKEYIAEYKKGKNCVNISNWNFQYLLHEPIDLLRKQIQREKCEQQPFIF